MSRLKFLSDALAIMLNEFRLLRRNRTAILISLVILPLFFVGTLGAGSGGAGTRFSPTAGIPIAFVDEDHTASSSLLWQRLTQSGDFDALVDGYSQSTAVATLGTGRIFAAIVVPQGFHEALTNNRTTSVTLWADDAEPGVGDQIASTLRKQLQDFNPNVNAQATPKSGLPQVEILQKGALFAGFNIGLTVVLGIVQIFATFYEIAGGMSRDREEGTYARLLLSPAGLGSIMLGKTLYDSVLGTARTLIVLGLAIYAYGARPNTDFGTLLVVSFLIALVTMAFGFLVSSLRVGTRAVVIIEFFLVLFLFAFSGLVIDKELLRGVSKTIASYLPWAYGFDMLRRTVLTGRPLLSLTFDLQFILAATLVFFGLAYVLFSISRERLIS